MWKWKLLKQTGVCLIIILTLMLAQSVAIKPLNKGAEVVMTQLSKNYSAKEVMTFAKDGAAAIAKAPVTLTNAVLSTKEASKYGQPIDDSKKGSTVPVYAVGGGTIVSVGENEQIGKFVKINHGDEAVSLYGNCKDIYVKELERVKKGQIIGTFKNDGKTKFYYSFSNSK